jgi:hypothetical protein
MSIKTTLETSDGKELKRLLVLKLLELNNIDNISELKDPKEQAIELKAQKRAFNKLREILSSITNLPEFKPKSDLDSYRV